MKQDCRKQKKDWTPTEIETTGMVESNGDLIYRKTKRSDHMAIKAEFKVNIVLPRSSGNIPMINYKSKDGWTKYKKLSDKYASDIRTIIKKHKDKKDRQDAFKKIIHKLDIEAFGLKYRKCKSTHKKVGKHKAKELKTLSQIVKEKHKNISNDRKKLKEINSINGKIWEMGKMVMGPKHKPAEQTAIYEPTTQDLLMVEKKLRDATLKYNVGVLTKNKVQQQDLEATKEKQNQHDRIMTEATKRHGEPLKDKTYRKVLKKKEQKDVQTHYKSRNELPGRDLRLHGGLYQL